MHTKLSLIHLLFHDYEERVKYPLIFEVKGDKNIVVNISFSNGLTIKTKNLRKKLSIKKIYVFNLLFLMINSTTSYSKNWFFLLRINYRFIKILVYLNL